MKTIKTNVFEFDELEKTAKKKARDWFREHALDYEWWDPTCEDASVAAINETKDPLTLWHFGVILN